MHLADEKARGAFMLRLDLRLAGRGGRHQVRIGMVGRAPHSTLARPALGPATLIKESPVQILPAPGFSLGVDQREHRPRVNRDLRALRDLKQPQRVAHFLVAPAVAARDGDAKELHVLRLQQHENCLQIRARRAKGILINDDLTPRPSVSTGSETTGGRAQGHECRDGEQRAVNARPTAGSERHLWTPQESVARCNGGQCNWPRT